MQEIKKVWKQSKLYRVLLIAAVIYTVLRLIFQGGYLAMMLLPELGIMGGIPDWVGTEGAMIPDDLRIYLDAATNLTQRSNLYLQGSVDRMEFYQYSPPFALFMTIFLWPPRSISAILHTGFHIIAYILLYIKWFQLFKRWSLHKSLQYLVWTLPVWLLFSSFWTDLGYLNVYILMALFSTLLIEAVIDENLRQAILWTSLILLVKPQWAFALAVPFLLCRWRFFAKIIAFSVIVYVTISGLTILTVGIDYGWHQQVDYVQILRGISSNVYPWRMPSDPFLGYNHSIKQILVYLLGAKQETFILTALVKAIVLLPLGIVSLRYLLNSLNFAGRYSPLLGLNLAFTFYLAAFIWLDMVWELSLSVAIYPYLLGTSEQQSTKFWLSLAFLPYALLDPLRTGSFALGGMNVVLPGLYLAADPAIYVPLIMIVVLVFYAVLIRRLWNYSVHEERMED